MTARVRDLSGPKPTFVALKGHQGLVNSASFGPDGTHVVTASHDKTARVWAARSRPSSCWRDISIRSTQRRSAPTERMSSRRRMTARRCWRVFPGVNELINIVRASLSRCLTGPKRRLRPADRAPCRGPQLHPAPDTRRPLPGLTPSPFRAGRPLLPVLAVSPRRRAAPRRRRASRRSPAP